MSLPIQAAAAESNVDLLEQSRQRSRAAEKARLEAAQLAKEQAIAAERQRIADLRAQQEAVPKTGQVQQGFRQEQGIYAGFSHNHRPVYVMNNVPNFVPEYTESEKQQVNNIFSQIVEEQKKLDQLLGTNESTTLQPPRYLTPDTRTGPNNTSIDYAGTLAAREQGYDVGSGLVSGLEPTFQKDADKRFGEHNKFIGLTENITTEKAKQVEQNVVQPKSVTPQNPRPHILTGQPDSKYANPDFAKNKQQKEKTVKLVENINAITGQPLSSAAPRAENLSATLFNVYPKKPKKLSDVEIASMTPAEISAYNKQVELYNQYVPYYNEKIKQQKAANIIVNREQFQRNREAFTKYISEAKAAGIKFVNIETKQGVQTIPIDQALQKRGVLGISAVPNVPEGFTAGYVAGELIAIPEGRQFVGPEKPAEPDYLKNFGMLIGAEALSSEKVLPKYYNEPGRVTSNEKLVASKQVSVLGLQNIKSPYEKANDFVEGLGTGLERTSLIITNVAPEVVIRRDIFGNKNAEQDVFAEHEKLLKSKGVGPSVIPSIETGEPTNRSVFYNVGELAGEVIPFVYGLGKEMFRNPFSKAPVKPKVPQVEAPEIAKTPLGIKSYPVAKLRDQGFGERPVLERGITPKEEFNIKKAMNIPEPFVQEAGTVRGAKDYGNLREQIANVKKPLAETTEKPVELEPFYSPKVEVRRAPEPNTFRVDESAMFGKDTASTIGKTEVPLGTSPLVKVEASRGPLGGSIIKQIVTGEPFKTEYIPLGAGRIKEIRLNLGESKLGEVVKTKTPVNQFDIKFNEKEIPETFKETISKPKPVEEDVFYKPILPKTRAKEIGTYRIQSEDILGPVENPKGVNVLKDIFQGMKEPSVLEGSKKPSIRQGIQKAELEKSYPGLMGKKAFERSAADAEQRRAENIYKFTEIEKVPLGSGLGERVPARPPPSRFVGLGRGRTFFVSRSTGESGIKKFSTPPPPPEEGGSGKGQQLLLEKPVETKGFTVTKVELGSTEKVGLVGAGGLAVAPAPLLIVAETDENGNPITNGTQTNGTATNGTGTLPPIVNPPQEIDLTPSVLEPSSITETRPSAKFGAATTTPSGLAYGLDALNARRSKNIEKIIIGPATGTKQKQETFAGFPNPSKQPSRLAQPGAFKQPQKEREREIFGTPFPNPQQPGLKTPTPFPQPEKLKQPEPLKQEPPKESVFGFRFAKPRESRKEKARKDKLDAFVGNVSDVDIGLGFNRKEITSGIKASEKRYQKDIRFAYKRGGFKKLITQHEGSLLSKKKRSILEREKPKEVKRQKRKTGGFF